jgi:hypothetical protein
MAGEAAEKSFNDFDDQDCNDEDCMNEAFDKEDFDDEEVEAESENYRAKRRMGKRRRSRRSVKPCSCPQCLMVEDTAVESFDDDDFDDDDFDDDDFDDDDFDDDDFMALDADDEDDLDDDADDDELMALDEDEEDDDELDNDDDNFDDEGFEDDDLDADELMAMDADDDDGDFDEEDDFDDESDYDDAELDEYLPEVSESFDSREPRWSARRDSSGNRAPFTDNERIAIRQALEMAHCWARHARNTFESIWNQRGSLGRVWRRRRDAWRSQPHVVEWFGGRRLTRIQIRAVRRRVRKIERILRKRRIRFVKIQHQSGKRSWQCGKSSTRSAYTFAGSPRKIFICPNFFTNTPRFPDPGKRARIIIHELVHEIGFCHYSSRGRVRCLRPGTRTPDEARTLARRHPTKARKNPKSYSELYQALGIGCP